MDNIELIRALYASFRSGDHARFVELCHDDLEWIQNEGFRYGGRHVGPANVVSGVFETLAEHWDGFGFDDEQMLDAGTHVTVVGNYRGTHRVSGRSFVAATVHLFDVVDGKVRRFRQFTDTALVRDALPSP